MLECDFVCVELEGDSFTDVRRVVFSDLEKEGFVCHGVAFCHECSELHEVFSVDAEHGLAVDGEGSKVELVHLAFDLSSCAVLASVDWEKLETDEFFFEELLEQRMLVSS